MTQSFSLIIPAYNEEARLPRTLNRICDWSKNLKFPLEVLVIDDGSTDNTSKIITEFSKKNNRIKLVKSKKNLGKMMQVMRGFKLARNEIIGVMDSDSAAVPTEFNRLFSQLNNADIVLGSRYLRGNLPPISGKSLFAIILSKGFTTLFRFFFAVPVYDPQIGFKVYKKNVIYKIMPLLRYNDDFVDIEIIIKAYGLGYKIKEVPVKYQHVPEFSKTNRIKVIIPRIISFISCWLDCYILFRQKKLLVLPSRGRVLLKLIYL